MLVVQIKPEKELLPKILGKKIFIFVCIGCEEVYFPRKDVEKFIDNLKEEVVGKVFLDYLCNREFVGEYIKGYKKQIESADAIFIFSCGVGTQVVSSLLENKIIYTGCDTLYLNGFQGLTSQEFDCNQCGQCYLNYTGGICPLTNCAKSLLNGPCGGAKDGKCEVNPETDCAWILIYKRLEKIGKLNMLKKNSLLRDYSKTITESLSREEIKK